MGGDAQKEAAGMDELQLGDLVQMRKTHPCGSDKWETYTCPQQQGTDTYGR